MESWLQISNPVGTLSVVQSYREFSFAVTMVIHKSRNLIGTLGDSESGPKYIEYLYKYIELNPVNWRRDLFSGIPLI